MGITNIAHAIGTVIAAAVIATGIMGEPEITRTSRSNSTETGATITRESRDTHRLEVITMLDDDMHGYANWSNGKAFIITQVDAGSPGMAQVGLSYMPSIAEEEGWVITGTIAVAGCDGYRANDGWDEVFLAFCARGSSVIMVIGNDRRIVTDIAEEVRFNGEFTVPEGFVRYDG